MTLRLGIALRECVRGTPDGILRALDAWAEESGVMPHSLALWRSLTREEHLGAPPSSLVDELRSRGVTPVCYVESVQSYREWIATGQYVQLLSGVFDDVLRTFQDPRIGWIRFDGEPNGPWDPDRPDFLPWRLAAPGLSRAAQRHVADLVRVPIAWGPVHRTAPYDEWWPGFWTVTFGGFDRYARSAPLRPLPEAWRAPIARNRSLSTSEIVVTECGSAAGLPDRAAWVRSMLDVEDVAEAILWDMDLRDDPAEDVSWRLTRAARKAAADVIRSAPRTIP